RAARRGDLPAFRRLAAMLLRGEDAAAEARLHAALAPVDRVLFAPGPGAAPDLARLRREVERTAARSETERTAPRREAADR
uniref:hypothetical protein n=1 Tax=Oceanicella sp. SM1341 TaxID=1548889 RepID=UPI0018E5A688